MRLLALIVACNIAFVLTRLILRVWEGAGLQGTCWGRPFGKDISRVRVLARSYMLSNLHCLNPHMKFRLTRLHWNKIATESGEENVCTGSGLWIYGKADASMRKAD